MMSARPTHVRRASERLKPEEDVRGFAVWCRATSARWESLDGNERFQTLLDTLRRIPSDCATEQQVMVARLIHDIVGRFLRDSVRCANGARLRGPGPRTQPIGAMRRVCDVGEPGAATGAPCPPHGNVHVGLALDLLATRCSDPRLNLSAVAEMLGLSRWHLSRVLSRTTGVGFRALLARSRLAVAKELLRTTRLSIKEVAARSGYEHVSNLDRQFRQSHGTTPREYRSLGGRIARRSGRP